MIDNYTNAALVPSSTALAPPNTALAPSHTALAPPTCITLIQIYNIVTFFGHAANVTFFLLKYKKEEKTTAATPLRRSTHSYTNGR